jgi:hypothetical protein
MVIGVSKALRIASCTNCRVALIHSFTAISGVPLLSTLQYSQSAIAVKRQARFFSNTLQSAAQDSEIPQSNDKLIIEDVDADGSHIQPEGLKDESEASSLPWYLQVDKPLSIQRPLSERQRIPDLPESSPAILQPLLQQISVDLGLDDLSLLDLRELDPPPALGANLLMVIGTARSEKHLHVSADRLCRWLRSEYKLRPDADGLLGRNELKLKMRRKNRRAKLIGSGNADDDFDDGVRTGWVCVNVGVVGSPADNIIEESKDEGFVGFGRQTEGMKIVVQMLVEEKRKELDLEKLWGGIKRRQSLAISGVVEDTTDHGIEDAPEEAMTQYTPSSIVASAPAAKESRTLSHRPFAVQAPASTLSSRRFHTSSRTYVAETARPSHDSSEPPFSILSRAPPILDLDLVRQEVLTLMKNGDFSGVSQTVRESQGQNQDLSNTQQQNLLMECTKQYLISMPLNDALRELGDGPTDFISTPFLTFMQSIDSAFPSGEEWDFRVWFFCFARNIGHKGYDLQGLYDLFEQLQLSGTIITKEMYLNILRSVLAPLSEMQGHELPPRALEMAVEVFQEMQSSHISVLSSEVFIILHEAFLKPPEGNLDYSDGRFLKFPNASQITFDLPTLEPSPMSKKLQSLMQVLDVQITETEDLVRLLDIYARNYDWPAFWNLWRSVPRNRASRGLDLYSYMFGRVAQMGHQKGCITVLRSWISEMDRELPGVRLDEGILEGVKACLFIADPSFQAAKLNNQDAKGEWLPLWRRCYPTKG